MCIYIHKCINIYIYTYIYIYILRIFDFHQFYQMNSPFCSTLGTLMKTVEKEWKPESPFISSKIGQTSKHLFLQPIHLPKLMIWMIPGTHPKQPRDPLGPLSETPDRPWAPGDTQGVPEAPQGPLCELKIRPSGPT